MNLQFHTIFPGNILFFQKSCLSFVWKYINEMKREIRINDKEGNSKRFKKLLFSLYENISRTGNRIRIK